jgi:hypothetical protein
MDETLAQLALNKPNLLGNAFGLSPGVSFGAGTTVIATAMFTMPQAGFLQAWGTAFITKDDAPGLVNFGIEVDGVLQPNVGTAIGFALGEKKSLTVLAHLAVAAGLHTVTLVASSNPGNSTVLPNEGSVLVDGSTS